MATTTTTTTTTSYRTVLTASSSSLPTREKIVESFLTSSEGDSLDEDFEEDDNVQEEEIIITVEKSTTRDIRYAFLPLDDGKCYKAIVRVKQIHARNGVPFEYDVELAWETRLDASIDASDIPEEFVPQQMPLYSTRKKEGVNWISHLHLPHHLLFDIPKEHQTDNGSVNYGILFSDDKALCVGDNHIDGYIILKDDTKSGIRRVQELIDYTVNAQGRIDYIVNEVYNYSLDGTQEKVPEAGRLPDEFYVDVDQCTDIIRDPTLQDMGYHIVENPSSMPVKPPFDTLAEFQLIFRHTLENIVASWGLERVKVERIIFKGEDGEFFYGFADPESRYKENAKKGLSGQGKHTYYFDSTTRFRISTDLNETFLQGKTQNSRLGAWDNPWLKLSSSTDGDDDAFDSADEFPKFNDVDRPHNHAILFGYEDTTRPKKHGKSPFRFFAEKEDFADGFGALLSYVSTRGQHPVFRKMTDQQVYNLSKKRLYKKSEDLGYYVWNKKRTVTTVWSSLMRAYIALSRGINDPIIIHFMHVHMPIAYAHYKTHFCD